MLGNSGAQIQLYRQLLISRQIQNTYLLVIVACQKDSIIFVCVT